MKRCFLSVLCALVFLSGFGQGMLKIKENFKENKFSWDEMVSKQGSVSLAKGKLIIKNEISERRLTLTNISGFRFVL